MGLKSLFPSAQRLANMHAGTQVLLQWLDDIARLGIKRSDFGVESIEAIASRMTDAQLPAIARQLRALPQLDIGSSDWYLQIQHRISFFLLLAESMQKFEDLSEIQQISLLQTLGFSIQKTKLSSVTSGQTEACWFYHIEERIDDQVRSQFCYGMTAQSKQFVLYIQHAFQRQDYPIYLRTKKAYHCKVYFYPHPTPWRCHLEILQQKKWDAQIFDAEPFTDISQVKKHFARCMNRQFWIKEIPVKLEGIILLDAADLILMDQKGQQLQIVGLESKVEKLSLWAFAKQSKIQVLGVFQPQSSFRIQIAICDAGIWQKN